MNNKLHTLFLLILFSIACTGLILINISYPNLEDPTRVRDTVTLVNGQESFGELNPSDSLIADETWVCTDEDTIGFTYNEEIASIIDKQPGCTVVFEDDNVWWFTHELNKPPHICYDPTHLECDSQCECDGMSCYNK